MPDALQILVSGVALGFSIAAPPGPVTALSAQQVVSRSWLSGWLVTLGATSADAIFFVLTYYGVARLVTKGERSGLFLLGGLLMLFLAVSTVRKAGRSRASAPLDEAPRRRAGGLRSCWGLSLGLTNPYQLGWWVAIGAGMVTEFGGSIAVGFFVGILSWTLVFTAIVRAGATRYQRLSPLIAYASAGLMAAFGLWFVAVGLSTTCPERLEL